MLMFLLLYVLPILIIVLYNRFYEEDLTRSKEVLVISSIIPIYNILIAFICILYFLYHALMKLSRNNKW